LTGLLVEAKSLVEELAAMVSPLVTTAGCCGLARLSGNYRSSRNGRDRARKGKGCQEFLVVGETIKPLITKA